MDEIEELYFHIHTQLVHQFHCLLPWQTRRRMELSLVIIATHLLLLCCLLHVSFVRGAHASDCLAPYFAALPSHNSSSSNSSNSSDHYTRQDARHMLVRIQVVPDDVPWLTALEPAPEPRSFVYAGHKALLTLLDLEQQQQQSASAGAISVHDMAKRLVRFEMLVLPRSSPCFALAGVGNDNGLWALVLHDVIGYDTILMNHLTARFGATGVFYHDARKTTTELHTSSAFSANDAAKSWLLFVAHKFKVAHTIVFLFFILTALVAFVLRETLKCIVTFTALFENRSQLQIAYSDLVLAYFAQSLLFVPVLVGMLFFLVELYKDYVLAFAVLTFVWLGESFAVVSARTRLAQIYFLPLFFCVFAAVHVYVFSFPLGFAYVAFGAATAVLMLVVLFFLNYLEVPALRRGDISVRRPRQPLLPAL